MADNITNERLIEWSERVSYPDTDDAHAMVAELIELRQLVADFIDPDDCWFDHRGGCQAHGYLSLERGQMCPHMEAKRLRAAWGSGDA